jgi:hypothetical protein
VWATPSRWRQDANQQALYDAVIGQSCATCHFAQSPNWIDLTSYEKFVRFANSICTSVFGSPPSEHAQPRLSDSQPKVMPHAPIPFWNFWLDGQDEALLDFVNRAREPQGNKTLFCDPQSFTP